MTTVDEQRMQLALTIDGNGKTGRLTIEDLNDFGLGHMQMPKEKFSLYEKNPEEIGEYVAKYLKEYC